MSWLFLSLSIVSEIIATLSLRASDGFRKKIWVLPLAVFYSLAFFFLAVTISYGMPVAIAYGIWSAVGVALIALLARIIWKEPLTPRMIFGLVLIMAGVLLVELG
ncbi:MAG TPA: multidrug efflux SMR transporter [Enteractinococcus helveticum]|uniref:Multidrug efflux SMR transporter n=1 Tax=Enteractinococcus helveticum TaxID=1837282 RepID=A0A921K8R0_9MICC|nr:multidrug efflux SMR transporter [Enteractinococcus helveticum]HJF14229.1 multidrug efflux SMR transporter [Enteractinococcus helveticum]